MTGQEPSVLRGSLTKVIGALCRISIRTTRLVSPLALLNQSPLNAQFYRCALTAVDVLVCGLGNAQEALP